MEKEELKKMILRHYETITDCAAAIGMSQSQFSRSLSKPSGKFLARLESAGVVLEKPQATLSREEKNDVEEIFGELKNVIYEKNMLLKEQREIISQKNNIIRHYEELVKSFKEKE